MSFCDGDRQDPLVDERRTVSWISRCSSVRSKSIGA